MLRALMARERALLTALSALLLCLPGCRAKVGSACKVSTDCSLRGDRTCDLSFLVNKDGYPDPDGKGECIVEGCSPTSCPREAVCVQVYSTEFLSVACDPEEEDRTRSECGPDEICLPEGVCADVNTARATCRRECRSDNSCRDGYVCRQTGVHGVYVARAADEPTADVETKICVPES